MKGTRILFAARGTRSLSIFLKQQTDDFALSYKYLPTPRYGHSRPQCLRVWECALDPSPLHAQKSSGSRLRYGQYLTHAHNHITRAVAAMDSCFALVGAHQHGIAVGSMSRITARIKMDNYTIFRSSKIQGEASKQEILQQMFRKF